MSNTQKGSRTLKTKPVDVDAELRLSEAVSTFGVGAIVDVRGESFVAPDTGFWKKYDVIQCQRLLDKIGPGELRRPQTIEQEAARRISPSMQLLRFPAWRFCEVCGRMSRFGKKSWGPGRNKCDSCGKGLVPMRFVAACEKGSHLQEVPWRRWLHSQKAAECHDAKQLYFERLRDKGEGLRSLQVTCRACNASRTLDELVGSHALTSIGVTCEGRQPWEHTELGCDSKVTAVLRGATNLFRAELVSALDIPASQNGSDPAAGALGEQIQSHTLFTQAKEYASIDLGKLMATQIATDCGVELAEVQAFFSDQPAPTMDPATALKREEWDAFQEKIAHGKDSGEGDFVVDGATLKTSGSSALSLHAIDAFSGIGQVRRLREVRAQTGFTRRAPDAKFVTASPGNGSTRVFPTAELFGEGIFISFSEAALASWEQNADSKLRSSYLEQQVSGMEWAERLGHPTPRLLMLHTFSHILLRRMAFESGYSTAALRERLYAGDEDSGAMCGLLIYTAAPDEQGTLGGLVRLGEPNRLELLIANALEEAEICSNDPICLETDITKVNSLNLAACHGCCMVSETSCELGNRFLDRQALFGSPESPESGFFSTDYLRVE